ncbi:hypothetical protein GOBAR_DD27338 [Gossypium barbadense]|nr:hypothetical protein GOBAR_DD27338 [Gossypium barbadense]
MKSWSDIEIIDFNFYMFWNLSGKLIPTINSFNMVTSPFGNNLHHNENATHGQFAFTTSESGNYLACFWKDGSHQKDSELTLGVDWKTGIAAKDWESVAKKEKIEGVELVLRRLQGIVETIRGNLIYLRDREADMREVSEATNARVAWFSIMSLGVCIAVSVLQIWYLKRYFVRDITSSPEWEKAYQYEIPILAKELSDGTEPSALDELLLNDRQSFSIITHPSSKWEKNQVKYMLRFEYVGRFRRYLLNCSIHGVVYLQQLPLSFLNQLRKWWSDSGRLKLKDGGTKDGVFATIVMSPTRLDTSGHLILRLVDLGSTHNFISITAAQPLGLSIQTQIGLSVAVDNREKDFIKGIYEEEILPRLSPQLGVEFVQKKIAATFKQPHAVELLAFSVVHDSSLSFFHISWSRGVPVEADFHSPKGKKKTKRIVQKTKSSSHSKLSSVIELLVLSLYTTLLNATS